MSMTVQHFFDELVRSVEPSPTSCASTSMPPCEREAYWGGISASTFTTRLTSVSAN